MRLQIAGLMVWLMATGAAACGADSDCMLGERNYRIAMPEGHDGVSKVPAIAFAHGYRGAAQGVMRNGSLRKLATDLGAALIAFNSRSGTWSLPYHPSHMESDGSDEFAYVRAVLDDALARYPLDPDRIMATGFSSGGMLVWNLACEMPERFAGFAPVAGTFWLVPPDSCATPVQSLVHIHGDADKTVPLKGRAIGETKQGEVEEALRMYAQQGDFSDPVQVRHSGLNCSEQSNPEGEILDFCLFEGGHSLRTEFLRHAWDRLKATGQL